MSRKLLLRNEHDTPSDPKPVDLNERRLVRSRHYEVEVLANVDLCFEEQRGITLEGELFDSTGVRGDDVLIVHTDHSRPENPCSAWVITHTNSAPSRMDEAMIDRLRVWDDEKFTFLGNRRESLGVEVSA